MWACLDQLLNRDQIAGKAVRSCAICKRRDRDHFKFHSQHLTSFTRHCAKTDHAESCGGALQLYRISITRHCAQCVDSLCSG